MGGSLRPDPIIHHIDKQTQPDRGNVKKNLTRFNGSNSNSYTPKIDNFMSHRETNKQQITGITWLEQYCVKDAGDETWNCQTLYRQQTSWSSLLDSPWNKSPENTKFPSNPWVDSEWMSYRGDLGENLCKITSAVQYNMIDEIASHNIWPRRTFSNKNTNGSTRVFFGNAKLFTS